MKTSRKAFGTISRAWRWLAPAALIACAPRPATELVVGIDADPVVAATLAQVTVTATREGAAQSFGARTVARDAIPGTLALVPSDADDGRAVIVDVAATAADGSALHQTARVAFVPEQTRYVSIHLVGGCRGVACGTGQTCAGAPCSDAAHCASACVAQTSLAAGAPPVPAPRPIAPASTARVTTSRPTFRFQLGAGSTGAVLEICRERSCATIEQTVDVPGASGQVASARVTGALSPGAHFWRLRERAGEVTRVATSATWEFFVGTRATAVDSSVGLTGDYNGDGYADLVTGAFYGSELQMLPGGPSGLDRARARSFPRFADGTDGASLLSVAGDVNGDGYADLLVGRSNQPAVVVAGGPDGISTASARTLSGGGDFNYYDVKGIGDVDGDGYADVAVFSYVLDDTHRLSVYRGSARGLVATASAAMTAYAVVGAGDLNADGYADVAALGPESSIDVYFGGANGLRGTPLRVASRVPLAPLGANFVRDFPGGIGDFNGDGYSDLLVYSSSEDQSGFDLRIWSGGPDGLSRVADRWTLFPAPFITMSAWAAGDTNADGFDDLAVVVDRVIGSNGYPLGDARELIWVFAGGEAGVGRTPSATLASDQADEVPTEPLVAGGDLNGDGFADMVTSSRNGRGETQRLLLFPGGASGPSLLPADAVDHAPQPGPDWGSSVFHWILARRAPRAPRRLPV